MKKLFNITCAIVAVFGFGNAFAGFSKIQGKAHGFMEFGDSSQRLLEELKREADTDARSQCSHENQIQRISPYSTRWITKPYAGYLIYVQADYLCGESDY